MPFHSAEVAIDALTYYADTATILRAAAALDAGEFDAWTREDQAAAARELRFMAEAYPRYVPPPDQAELDRMARAAEDGPLIPY